jgi:tetratricopeptide (TPR) repeat protein
LSGTWASFLPGVVVLAIGLAAGLLLAARLRRSRERSGVAAAAAGGADQRDLELERADLEARRAEIYARLRGDAEEEMGEADRRDLELAAARTLRRLEQLDAIPGARSAAPGARSAAPGARRAAAQEAPPATATAAAATARPRAHAGVVGFAYGAGFAALAALLLYWVARDAKPRPEEQPAAPMAAAGAPDDAAHSRLDELSPEAKARVTAILARLEQEPADLDARKALAETYVVEGLFFEAFEQSELILEQSPGDVDGLYFQGLIRLTMGQDEIAVELLDQALASEPGFVSARLVRGLARLRRGERDAAMDDWRQGLDAAGGKHEGLERLLELAASGASAEEILGSPPPAPEHPPLEPGAGPTAGELADASVPAAGSAPAAGGGAAGAYRARLELAPEATAPAGAVLFVNLRIVAAAGPPSAVKRIESPRFPIEITLDTSDAMPGLAGRPLPATGVISARLDTDGNASTRDDSEPSAQVEAAIGEPVTLVLR